MARIRTIKPEFWTNEQVMELSPMARLLFIGLWNFCDDKGVHPVAFKTLKAEVFPADDILSSDIERLIQEVVGQGLLTEFYADSRQWWFVTGWHHQLINRPSKSRYPSPPRIAPLPEAAGLGDSVSGDASDERANVEESGVITEDSLNAHGVITEDSLTEGKGGEGKGVNPNPPTAREQASGESFRMFSDWKPSAHFASLAHQSGLPIPGNEVFDMGLGEFISYWLSQPRTRTQHEWDHALVKSLKADKLRPAPAPSMQARASPVKRQPNLSESRGIAAGTRLSDLREAPRGQNDERTIDADPNAVRCLG